VRAQNIKSSREYLEEFIFCARKEALGELPSRGRTAERDPSKLAWERAGDQPEPSGDEVRGEVDSLVHLPRQIFVTTEI
jgi:hypothetical protein